MCARPTTTANLLRATLTILAILCVVAESATLQRPKRQWLPVYYWVPSYYDEYEAALAKWYRSYICRFTYCHPAPELQPMPRGETALNAEVPSSGGAAAPIAAGEPPTTELEAEKAPLAAAHSAPAPPPSAPASSLSNLAAHPPEGAGTGRVFSENAAAPPPSHPPAGELEAAQPSAHPPPVGAHPAPASG